MIFFKAQTKNILISLTLLLLMVSLSFSSSHVLADQTSLSSDACTPFSLDTELPAIGRGPTLDAATKNCQDNAKNICQKTQAIIADVCDNIHECIAETPTPQEITCVIVSSACVKAVRRVDADGGSTVRFDRVPNKLCVAIGKIPCKANCKLKPQKKEPAPTA
ncbi:MAG TPA: hypothetical protein VJH37_01605 [Candidatus Nanoarchaeia archaeon]|nr:hypothetical protein [Candidatus Nanoarchaeia archaeon]